MASAATPKQAVNMTLSTEIVRRAKALVGERNLSGTVDKLLAAFVAQTEAGRIGHREKIARWVAASNAVIAEHGSPVDEYDLP